MMRRGMGMGRGFFGSIFNTIGMALRGSVGFTKFMVTVKPYWFWLVPFAAAYNFLPVPTSFVSPEMFYTLILLYSPFITMVLFSLLWESSENWLISWVVFAVAVSSSLEHYNFPIVGQLNIIDVQWWQFGITAPLFLLNSIVTIFMVKSHYSTEPWLRKIIDTERNLYRYGTKYAVDETGFHGRAKFAEINKIKRFYGKGNYIFGTTGQFMPTHGGFFGGAYRFFKKGPFKYLGVSIKSLRTPVSAKDKSPENRRERGTPWRKLKDDLFIFHTSQETKLMRMDLKAHACVVSGSGGGKTVSVVIPQIINWGSDPEQEAGSLIILDPKGELYEQTADYRRSLGHKVYKIQAGDKSTDSFNPLLPLDPYSGNFTKGLRTVVQWVMGGSSDEKESNYYEDTARRMFGLIVAWLIAEHGFKEQKGYSSEENPFPTLYHAATVGFGSPDEMRKFVEHVKKKIDEATANNERYGEAHDMIGKWANGFTQEDSSDAEVWGNLCSSIQQKLEFVVDGMSAPLLGLDLEGRKAFDPRDILNGKTTIYLVFEPDMMQATPAIHRITIGALLNTIYLAGPKFDNSGKPVMFLLDELQTMGPMPDIISGLSYGRGKGLRLVGILQSPAIYKQDCGGDGVWNAWLSNSDIRHYFKTRDLDVAEEVCKELGKTSIQRTKYSTSTKRDLLRGFKPKQVMQVQETFNTNDDGQAADLMTIDDIKTLPNRYQIVFRSEPTKIESKVDPILCGTSYYGAFPSLSKHVKEAASKRRLPAIPKDNLFIEVLKGLRVPKEQDSITKYFPNVSYEWMNGPSEDSEGKSDKPSDDTYEVQSENYAKKRPDARQSMPTPAGYQPLDPRDEEQREWLNKTNKELVENAMEYHRENNVYTFEDKITDGMWDELNASLLDDAVEENRANHSENDENKTNKQFGKPESVDTLNEENTVSNNEKNPQQSITDLRNGLKEPVDGQMPEFATKLQTWVEGTSS